MDTQNTHLSPTLDSYAGMGDSELMGLASAQQSYSPAPPQANMNEAMQLVQSADQATDPKLAKELLERAVALLTPNGGGNASSGAHPTHAAPEPSSDDGSDATSADGTDAGPSHTGTPLSVSGNSVNTGMYTISAGTTDDGSLTITNNQTGASTEVWGDPHVKVNGQDTADFQKGPLNIQLQDGTQVHIDPTALTNGVAHIGQVSITKGNQSVEMGGTGTNGFEQGVNTSAVQSGNAGLQRAMYNTPDATDITLGADGNLYQNNANGSMGAEIQAPSGGAETDLDGLGGGMVGQRSASDGGSTAQTPSASDMQSVMNTLQGLVSGSQTFSGYMIQNLLSAMESRSGYPSTQNG